MRLDMELKLKNGRMGWDAKGRVRMAAIGPVERQIFGIDTK
jgi:hypothetical protein